MQRTITTILLRDVPRHWSGLYTDLQDPLLEQMVWRYIRREANELGNTYPLLVREVMLYGLVRASGMAFCGDTWASTYESARQPCRFTSKSRVFAVSDNEKKVFIRSSAPLADTLEDLGFQRGKVVVPHQTARYADAEMESLFQATAYVSRVSRLKGRKSGKEFWRYYPRDVQLPEITIRDKIWIPGNQEIGVRVE